MGQRGGRRKLQKDIVAACACVCVSRMSVCLCMCRSHPLWQCHVVSVCLCAAMCSYKGMTYTQGQKWDDGCDYSCECVDEKTGRYVCNQK